LDFELDLNLDLLMIISSRFSVEFWWYTSWNKFRYVVKYGFGIVFSEWCFENYGYNDDDLGAPSMWFQLGRVTSLDGAAPMERLSLGGEGYQWEVNYLIEDVLHFCWVERKELSVRWSHPYGKATIRRRGLSTRWS